jgi:hypothetical protein
VAVVARTYASPQPPIIAGQAVSASVVAIDFTKRYDLHCSLLADKLTVYGKCKIIGFTGEAGSGSSGPSIGYGGFYAYYFNAWLVLEREDGRRAYLPPSSLKFMEESERN